MNRSIVGLSLIALCGLSAGAGQGRGALVVHEWGTFLAMAGSDGVTLDGMYHEEHALPGFVHARSKEQLRMRSVSLKGETPVIYFYTDSRLDVNVRVKFPDGIWTQWYPQASMVAPGLAATQLDRPHHGHICWNVEVTPPRDELSGRLPLTQSDALWNYARQVDAAFVRSHRSGSKNDADEIERFIFYRGLGRADLPLRVSSDQGGTLRLGMLPGGEVKHLFVIRVEHGMAAYRYIPSLRSGETVTGVLPPLQGAMDIAGFSQRIGVDLGGRLIESGLYPKEAAAMVNTWRKSYFENDGVRVLFVLPQQWTDSFIPMTVNPKPSSLVRVMVGRTELLTPEREARAESSIKELASSEAGTRERAFTYLRSQGRYVEPVVNRVLGSTQDQRIAQVCRRLLATDYVTELRSAVNSASDGSKVEERPVEVHATLAALLRQLGYGEEAGAEARSAEMGLAAIPPPRMDQSDSRWYLRAYARAKEGLGDDRGAAQYYERLVRFGSQSRTCHGCHEAAGPRSMAFYRDWWAGRKYAEYIGRQQLRDTAIRQQREVLARDSHNTAAQMLLAYLTASAGDRRAADKLWNAIEGRSAVALPAARAQRNGTSIAASGR